MGNHPKHSMHSGECFQNGALEGGVTEPGTQWEKERIQTPTKLLAGYRMRVYNINPRFLEQRQARAVKQFEVHQESLLGGVRQLEEYAQGAGAAAGAANAAAGAADTVVGAATGAAEDAAGALFEAAAGLNKRFEMQQVSLRNLQEYAAVGAGAAEYVNAAVGAGATEYVSEEFVADAAAGAADAVVGAAARAAEAVAFAWQVTR